VKTSEKLLRRDTSQFAMLCEDVLQRGLQVRFLAHGQSMQPNVLSGDAATPVSRTTLPPPSFSAGPSAWSATAKEFRCNGLAQNWCTRCAGNTAA
jgi:hypothetical protein